ncbi:hypothetical protein [Gallaecimonas pentaromativorans]|uniref:Thioredoxin domain-containing protein n=1 Tax=Gallaecimonas pentaromativorans TaxID=584787 RepID=A0A3N1P496_9GAMM|nr:hypothetical protein [Gallaecimonas pentaromativorans]ROQ21977.1 hypothetical protein EDC28_11179 [Gallaecimonas pentaromativorans]
MTGSQAINGFAKFSVSFCVLALAVAVFLKTEPGRYTLDLFFNNNASFLSLAEKEKQHNLNMKIDLSTKVVVQGKNARLGDFINRDTLILPYVENCPSCDELVHYLGQQRDVPFLVIAFDDEKAPAMADASNRNMVVLSTAAKPSVLYMDAILSPVLYEVDGDGVIKAKYPGFSADKVADLVNRLRG